MLRILTKRFSYQVWFGVIIGFHKKCRKLTEANDIWILHVSWLMFVLAITSTLLSYLFGQRALNRQREFSERYFLDGDEDAGQQKSLASRMTRLLSYVSVFTYIAAVACTAFFIGSNLENIPAIG